MHKEQPGYKIFPIKTDTACMLKWSWSTVFLNKGRTSSCHRVFDGMIDPDNFNSFHNNPSKLAARQAMLNGQWPDETNADSCRYCRTVEEAGGKSDRIMQLEQYHLPSKIPPELFVDPTTLEVTPTTLEIYFKSTCNFSCVYCTPRLSSKWNDELRIHGPISIEDLQIDQVVEWNPHYDRMVSALWEYLHENDRYKIIKHFHLLGGEPLLQAEFDDTIQFWADHPNPDLTINLITNLSLPHKRFVEKINKFKELVDAQSIYQLQLTASIDCWGKEQEYSRHGLDLQTWEDNLRYVLDKDWIFLSFNSCITNLTIKTTADLISKIKEWNKSRPNNSPIQWTFGFPIGDSGKRQHPKVLGYNVFKDDIDKILASLDTPETQGYKNYMQSLFNSIKHAEPNPNDITVLKLYLTELDRRRGTNWKETFPWLESLN